ncbi:MAG: ribosomal protein L7/L12 [Planctomycetaceae bacterium]|nr:ribosomal protein L7/L12 [Planctomycetaceae bacterium]
MTTCQFCDHRNPPGQHHCEKCGAELSLEPAAPEAAADGEPSTGLDAEIKRLLQQQGKIAAIKRYREATGVGLAEAKYAVEQFAERTGVASGSGKGCTTVLAVMLATIGCAVACWNAAARTL